MTSSFLIFRCGPYRFALESESIAHVSDSRSGDDFTIESMHRATEHVDLNELLGTGEASSSAIFQHGTDGQMVRINVTDIEGLIKMPEDAFSNLPLFNRSLSKLVAGTGGDGDGGLIFQLNPPSLWMEGCTEEGQ